MFSAEDLHLFEFGSGKQKRPRFDFDGTEPDRVPGMARAFVLCWVGIIYSTGTSNFDRFPKYYAPFKALGITEPMLAVLCLWLGVVGLIGGLTKGFYGWSARMLAGMWSASFWTIAAAGLAQGNGGFFEVISLAAYSYIAFKSWRQLVRGGRA